ncbi:MAG: DDE-type integrase/transposase/recombinase [Xenococcaceae cyanobacterium MO_167.B27]|nr:DDE-type integrase/transposase/recombinase [Xenococcaceae cyanobacterium MO_167.B27]
MSKITLRDGLKFELYGQEYELIARIPPGDWKIRNVVTIKETSLSETDIIDLLFKGELQFITAKFQQHIAFPDLNETDRNNAIWREKYVKKVLEEGINKSTKQALEPIIKEVYRQIKLDENIPQEIQNKPKPSYSSVYQWVKKYKQSEGSIHSLVSNTKKKGNRNSRLAPEVHNIIQQAIDEIYLNRNQGSIKDTYDRVIVLIVEENQYRQSLSLPELKIPNYMAIRNIIKKIPSQKRDEARLGKRTSDLIHRPVSAGKSLNPTRPLEVVEIDHCKLPFFVLDNEHRLPVGLPWLTSAIDVYSQTVVGYYLTFDPPSYLSVMYCLLHSIRAKEYVKSEYARVKNNWTSFGLMETLKVDNGRDFRGKSLEDACRELKVNLEFCPVRTPWYKPTVERYFGSIQKQLNGKIPGSCAKFLEENDYDPKKQAVVTLDELQEIIHIFLIDIHNQSSHTKFKNPRASVWDHGVLSYPISLPSSDDTLKVLLGDIEERTISRKGIEFYYLFYNSDRLQALRDRYEAGDFRRRDKIRGREKAKFKYNRNDISVIHVFDPQTREYVAVPAINQNYTQSLSLAQHRIIHRYALNQGIIQNGQNVDVVALALAKQQIQNIVGDAIKKTKAAKTSKQVIKYMGTGRGEDIIFAQERSKGIEPANPFDEITVDAEPVLSNINAGISDFSSAVELDAKAEEISVEILPENSVNTKSETKPSKTQKKSQSKAGKKSIARKSKSERKNKTSSTANKKQQESLREKQHIIDNLAETSSSTNKKQEQPPKQETKSRASIGLPQWKPPSR